MITVGIFGERLKQIRTARGLSQKIVADNAGITAAQVSRYEAGLQTPTEDAIRRIAQFLGVSADYLLGLTDDPSPKPGELPEMIKRELQRLESIEEKKRKVVELLQEAIKTLERDDDNEGGQMTNGAQIPRSNRT